MNLPPNMHFRDQQFSPWQSHHCDQLQCGFLLNSFLLLSLKSERYAAKVNEETQLCCLRWTIKNSSIFEVRDFRYGFHEQIIWEHLQYLKCRLLLHCFFRYQFAHCICYHYVATFFPWFDISTVELVLWETSLQETPPFRGHKIWSRKNVDIIFDHNLLPLLKEHLYSGERDTFYGSQNPG